MFGAMFTSLLVGLSVGVCAVGCGSREGSELRQCIQAIPVSLDGEGVAAELAKCLRPKGEEGDCNGGR